MPMISLRQIIRDMSHAVMKVGLVSCFASVILIMVPQTVLAQEDPWLDSLRNAKGMSVGDLEPRYPDLEGKKPVVPEGTGPEVGGVPGEEPGGPVVETKPGVPGIDPAKLNPDSPDVAAKIREFLSTAKPYQNVTEGANFLFDKWGDLAGTTIGGEALPRRAKPDDAGARPPTVYAWEERSFIDSVNHCTLGEYVISKLSNKSLDHCRGRYQKIGDLRGKPLDEAKTKLSGAGLKFTEKKGSDAPSKEQEGAIESHKPGPGLGLKRGGTVKLTYFGPYSYFNDAMTAVNKCEFDEAEKFIKQMPDGPKKKEVKKEHKAARKLEDEIKGLVSDAYNESKGWNFETALSLYDVALSKAECDRHRESIEKKIAAVRDIKKKADKLIADARADINACRFESAQKQIDRIPAGSSSRKELEKEHESGKNLEEELKDLIRKAHDEAESWNFETALSLYDVALDKAKCDRHRESIEKKIAAVRDIKKKADKLIADARADINACRFEEALTHIDRIPASYSKKSELVKEYSTSIKLRDKIKTLGKEANEEYRTCEYDKALKTLNEASNKVRCEYQRKTIKDNIAIIQRAKAYEETTSRLYRQAKVLYEQGNLQGALEKSRQAYNHTKCQKHKDGIGDLIARIEKKKNVPYVVEKDVKEAQRLIRGAGLVPSVTRDKSPPNRNIENTVYSQDPRGNTRIKQGSRVRLYAYGKYIPQVKPDTGKRVVTGAWRLVKQTGPKTGGGRFGVGNGVKLNFQRNTVYYNTKMDYGFGRIYGAGVSFSWTDPPSLIKPGERYHFVSVKGHVTDVNPTGHAGARIGIGVDKIGGGILRCLKLGKGVGCDNFADAVSAQGKAYTSNGEVQITLGNKDPDEFKVSFWITDGSSTLARIREYTYRRDSRVSQEEVPRVQRKPVTFRGLWNGTATISLGSQGGVNYHLQFSVDQSNRAQGNIRYQEDVVNLTGRVNGKNITLEGEKQYDGASMKVTLKGTFNGNGAKGNFGMTMPDMECVMSGLFDDSNNQCPQTTYRGSWSATRR